MTLAGIITLPVGAAAAYLTYQKLTDPHLLTYSGHGTTTLDAAWSPDGTRVASIGWLDGGTVQVWDATTGKRLQTCRVEHPVQGIFPLDVLWSSDGKYVLAFVGSNDEMLMAAGSQVAEMGQVWDTSTGQRVRSIPVMEPVTVDNLGTDTDRPLVRKWALNEHFLATVNPLDQGRLEIWEIATGNKIATLSAENQSSTSQVQGMVWAPDNEKLAMQWLAQDTTNGQNSLSIEIWNIPTPSKITTLKTTNRSISTQIFWAPDSRRLLVLDLENGAKRTYTIWDTLAGQKLQTFQPPQSGILSPIWSPDGKYLVLENEIYDVGTGNRITTFITQGMATSLAWSPDSTRIALVDSVKHGAGFSSTSSTLVVLDALSNRQRANYTGGGLFGNSGTSGKLIWSPDGKKVLVIGQQIDIWRGE